MTDVFKGATDQSVFIELVDSTTGLPKTAIVFGDVTGSYSRTRGGRVAITMATLASASAAHSDGGFILVDDTNQPGVYRVDIPDAAFATGAAEVVCTFKATGCRTVSRLFDLVNINNQVAYVPNAAADAAGGLPVSDAGGLDLDAKIGALTFTVAGDVDVNVQTWGGTAISTPPAVNASQFGGAAVTATTSVTIPASSTLATTTGAVASVTGAVASVTGNVGGDVVGSVASVTGNVGGNVTGNVTGSVGSIATGGIVAASFGAGAINAAAIATDAIGSDELAASAVTEIQAGLALAATALSTTQWTNTLATNLGTTNTSVATNLDATISSRASQTSVDDVPTNAELTTALGTGTWASAIPWNAAWDAEVESECADAITAAGLATAANLLLVDDLVSYCLTVLVGACSDAGTAAETYVRALNGETFTVDFTGLDATGNRTTTTLSKV